MDRATRGKSGNESTRMTISRTAFRPTGKVLCLIALFAVTLMAGCSCWNSPKNRDEVLPARNDFAPIRPPGDGKSRWSITNEGREVEKSLGI